MDEPNKTGLGCPPGGGCSACGGRGCSACAAVACDAENLVQVYRLLHNGSPRLALAKAMCVPFQPTLSNVRAVFAATSTPSVLNVAADQQYSQDTEITAVEWLIQNESATANSSIFQDQSDYFYSRQSGISATLQLGKAPFYGVAPQFTPLQNLTRSIDRVIRDRGWVLGKTQQITMSFNADVAIPYAPIEVIVTFTGQIPMTDEFMDGNMSKADAIRGLEDIGVVIPRGYRAWHCR